MRRYGVVITVLFSILIATGCADNTSLTSPKANLTGTTAGSSLAKRISVANGWYEGSEIYYIDHGVEEGVTERGENDIYLIGGNRVYQAQVVEFIPGESGYSPHWNVLVVHTAEGVTTADIAASDYASSTYPEALFDDVEDILGAESVGLITIDRPGVVVNCPVVSEKTADAPGTNALSEDFPPFPETF